MGKTQRVVGIGLIVLALMLAAYAWTLGKEMTQRTPGQSVVVATEHIAAGTVLTPEKLQLMVFPTRPAGSFGELAGVVGKVTPVDIAAGEPLLLERLTVSQGPSLKQLEAGERAMAVRVDEVIAVGNRLAPGDKVDVFATFRRNNDEIPESQSRLILSSLRILAFGALEAGDTKKLTNAGATRNVAETPRTAVLAVPLADVDKLTLAAETGRLLLALRPALSADAGTEAAAPALPASETTLNLRDLTGAARSPVKTPSAPPLPSSGHPLPTGPSVKVMHGLKESSVQVGAQKNGAGQ